MNGNKVIMRRLKIVMITSSALRKKFIGKTVLNASVPFNLDRL